MNNKMGWTKAHGATLLAAAALLASASAAHADSRVNWSLSVGVPLAQPVYVQPAPVYVQPAPVYVRPAPVIYQESYVDYRPVRTYTQPVYVQEDFYWVNGRRYYRGHHDGRRWEHEHHDHGRHRGHN